MGCSPHSRGHPYSQQALVSGCSQTALAPVLQHMHDHLKGREGEVILPQMAIEMLYELSKGEALITTGVGQHQMWAG